MKRVAALTLMACALLVTPRVASPELVIAASAPLPPHVVRVTDPTDPDVLARALSAPRNASTAPAHQIALHALTLNPRLREPTLNAMTGGRSKTYVTRELDAAVQLRSMTKPQKDLPKWRIIDPPAVAELRAAYNAAEEQTGIQWNYLAAVNFVETKMGRIRGTSTAGAQGPMQFMPATWKSFGNGGDIDNTNDAIAAAARYLKASGGPKNMRKALYAYNHSEKYVNAVTAYARNLADDPALLADYHAWLVIYRWGQGDVLLQTGYLKASQ